MNRYLPCLTMVIPSGAIAADGSSIVLGYDSANRVTQQLWYNTAGAGVNTQLMTYDSAGHLLTAGDINGTYSFSYDGDYRVTQVAEPFGVTLNYAYLCSRQPRKVGKRRFSSENVVLPANQANREDG